MKQMDSDICIVGGGLVGLAAALTRWLQNMAAYLVFDANRWLALSLGMLAMGGAFLVLTGSGGTIDGTIPLRPGLGEVWWLGTRDLDPGGGLEIPCS